MANKKQNRLQELDRSNFEVAKGEPDIRGWDVRYRNGEKIGSVEELIIDAAARKVRYMIVDLGENELRLEKRKISVPIGFAELDDRHDDVLIPNVSVDQLCNLPDYDKNTLSPDMERRISSTFGRKLQSRGTATNEGRKIREPEINDDMDPEFYRHEHYKLDNLYKNRLHQDKRLRSEDAEYDRGLNLWEKRNEGGILIDTSDLTDEERDRLLKYRRELYRERRYKNESV
jgi:sporulation protein YlmC with PRC-barrel domain